MKFVIKEITIQNFLSWKGPHSFSLDDQGTVLVTGVNGAGKSSIFDAICWAIYGRTTKPLLADEVVNNVAKKDCFVKLDLVVNNKEISITRFRKHSEYGSKVEIDGIAGSWDTVAGAQSVIDSVINLTYERFIQTFFFSQGDRRYFTNLKEADQRKVLSEIFQFEKFKEAAKQARAEIKELAAKVTEIRLEQSRIEGNLEINSQNIQHRKDEIKNRKKKPSLDVESLKKEKLSKEKRKVKLEEEYELLRFAAHEVSSLEDKLEIEEKKREAIRRSLNKLKKGKNKSCPTCGSSLTDTKHYKLLEKAEEEYQASLTAEEDAKRELEVIQEDYDPTKLKEKKTSLDKLQREIVDINTTLKVEAAARKDSVAWLTRYEKTKAKLEKEKAKVTKELEKKQKKVLYYEFWENGFGTKGIETFALKKILPHFNAKINEFLVKLPTKKGIIKATFLVEGSHLLLSVDFAGANKYSGVSGGEKRRIDLAVSLALISMSGVSSNILLLDEPFEGLEASSYSDVVQVLDSLSINSIFVTSHNSEIKAHFANMWEVEIDEKSSRLQKHTTGSKQIL